MICADFLVPCGKTTKQVGTLRVGLEHVLIWKEVDLEFNLFLIYVFLKTSKQTKEKNKIVDNVLDYLKNEVFPAL